MKYILIMIEFWKRRKKVSGGKAEGGKEGRGRKRILTHWNSVNRWTPRSSTTPVEMASLRL
jgi:hypothetical protein